MQRLFVFLLILMIGIPPSTFAADRMKDFRGTSQSLALIALPAEFLETTAEERLLQELRKRFNKYSKSYGPSSIESFKMANNPGKQFFRPVADTISEGQKQFLKGAAKDNSVDIIVLGSLRQAGEEVEVELQLFDSRIEALSKTEKASLRNLSDQASMDNLVYRVMNYLDREGYVYGTAQDFLEPPLSGQMSATIAPGTAGQEGSINPLDFASGTLAGSLSVGGDREPFWEKWWFWTIIGGSLITAGMLSYYFVVVDNPPIAGNVSFEMP